jgi:hypothetical protein
MEFTLFSNWYEELDCYYPQLKELSNVNFENYEVENGVKVIINSLEELKKLQEYVEGSLIVDFYDMIITIDD